MNATLITVIIRHTQTQFKRSSSNAVVRFKLFHTTHCVGNINNMSLRIILFLHYNKKLLITLNQMFQHFMTL